MKKLKRRIDGTEGAVYLLGYLLYLLYVGYLFQLVSLDLSFLLLNVLLFSFVYFAVLVLTGRVAAAMPLAAGLMFLLHYADECVFAARLTHIRLSDFSAVEQAMRVASHYDPVWSAEQWKQLLLLAGLSALLILIRRVSRLKAAPFSCRSVSALLLVLLAVILVQGTRSQMLPIPGVASGFDANSKVQKAGLLGYWYSQAVNRKSEKPDGYSREKAREILARYTDESAASKPPSVNLIVVMNEALTDYSLLGEPMFEDPLPYIHSMVEKGELFEGKLAASVLGGGTCNTEYEFLTGHSMVFLPDGVYAFMAYVTGEADSVARELEASGYHTGFFHPYYSQEWNREAVYSFFGFDRFTAGDTLEGGFVNRDSVGNITQPFTGTGAVDAFVFGKDLEYVRALISDSQTYRLLTDMIAPDDSAADDFLFCVTIQNHGGYTYEGEDFESTEYVTGDDFRKYLQQAYSGELSSNPTKINQYLTLSNLSDAAFAELISALSEREEKTLLVMFGDHQPGINVSDYMAYRDDVLLPVQEESHVVPYLVWSNFDLDYAFPDYISANFLAPLIKESVGLPLTAWDQFRLDVMQDYPVMTTNFTLDKDHRLVTDLNSGPLGDYALVQYMRMFDR